MYLSLFFLKQCIDFAVLYTHECNICELLKFIIDWSDFKRFYTNISSSAWTLKYWENILWTRKNHGFLFQNLGRTKNIFIKLPKIAPLCSKSEQFMYNLPVLYVYALYWVWYASIQSIRLLSAVITRDAWENSKSFNSIPFLLFSFRMCND